MSQYWMFEAALRSLVMGAAIFATLKVLRVRQVRAQRIAWVLTLLAAVAMPALVRWPIAMRLPAPHLPTIVAPSPSRATLPDLTPIPTATVSEHRPPHPVRLDPPPAPKPAHTLASYLWRHAGRYAALAYLVVTPLLVLRLAIGLGLTWRLLRRATPADLPGPSDIRISDGIRTPVTIGSTIVLPTHSEHWEPAKLNVVLAHERAHVQNADFYIQLVASVHCAIFWFSPLSWWLQRKLAALGEALGDLAALQQAESRSSYTEVLLEFATSVRQPVGAVAMARSGSLRARIERLLNDRLFRDAFTETRRHLYLAASVVPIALLVSASIVRVEGRQVVQAAEVQASHVVDIAPVAPQVAAPAPFPAEAVRAEQAKLAAESEADSAQEDTVRTEADADREQAEVTNTQVQEESATDKRNGYAYGDWDGDSFALIYGDGKMTFNGDYNDHVGALRQKVKGDFIYYSHGGKSYVITDPSLIAQAKALYAPIEALGKQQEELGRRQEALGKQQELLGKKQEAINVPTPDFTKELERLSELTAKMKALQSSKTVDERTLAEMQEKMADIQGRLGDLQGVAGEQQGRLGEEQGKLGEQQGKLGEEQGRLGEMQGKIADEANRKLKPMIEKAVRDGLAKQVD